MELRFAVGKALQGGVNGEVHNASVGEDKVISVDIDIDIDKDSKH